MTKIQELIPYRVYKSDRIPDCYSLFLGMKHIKIRECVGHITQDVSGNLILDLTAGEVNVLRKRSFPIEAIIRNHIYGGRIAFMYRLSDKQIVKDVPLGISLDEEINSAQPTVNHDFTVELKEDDCCVTYVIEAQEL